VTGEPGIGKTRLIEEFRMWCVHQGAVSAVARSYAAEGVLAYAPVVEWLRSESFKARFERLDPARLTELARLLPERLPKGSEPALAVPLPESDQRQRLFDAAAQAILAAGGPLLLVADDLHWWDQESLQFLHYLLRVQPQARLLVAASARREAIDPQHPLNDLRASLHALGRFTEIDLGRLAREDTAILAQRVTGHPLQEPDADQLYEETEGNPLFIVETLRAGWERGATKRRTSPKVQAVIESRLGQLSEPARDLVGLAATIGREFTAEVLAAASEADENALVHSLDELWRRRIIREQGADAYDFSHDKIREVAYLALSPARRRHCHLRVAEALERLYVLNLDPVSGQIAAHYERAARGDQAIAWYERAAEAAQQLHANLEAIRLLDRALNLLRALQPGPVRQTRELAILTALPAPMVAVEGYQSSRVTEVHQRALDLTRVLEVEPEPPLLRSLALASLSRGDYEMAHGMAVRLRARGERDTDDVLLVEAAYVLGIAAFWTGQFEAARQHFDAAVQRYRPEHRRAHLLQYGQDPKVVCLSRLGNTLWFLGRFDAARRARDAALGLAEQVGHPYSHWIALVFAAMLALELGELEQFRLYAARATAVWTEPATHNQITADGFNGYIAVAEGRVAEGIALIERGLATARGAKPVPGIDGNLVLLLLAACEKAGAAEAGLWAAERALASEGGARAWEAEAHRLRGKFLAAQGGAAEEVEAELELAFEVARRQGAQALVLRAATTLARYRAGRGDGPGTAEARQRLAVILEALPEGRDTPDVREGAALLAQS
jgi:tetratricopeptide (TPR) repeat protein